MGINDLMKEFTKIDYAPLPSKKDGSKKDKKDFKITLSKKNTDSIQGCIDDIEELIKLREELHKELMKDMEKIEVDISNFQIGKESDMPREEVMLFKEKSIELSESKRKELLDCWRDIAKLKEELRKYKQVLIDKQERENMLNSILDGE